MSHSNWSRRAASLAALLLAVGTLSACTGGTNAELGARAELKVMLPQELASADVAQVSVEVSGPGIPLPLVADLARNGNAWQGAITNIPAGTDRRFTATAFSASGTALYKGQSAATPIAAGSTVSVALTLQPVEPPVPYENEAPIIDSLVVSANVVVPGGSIQLTATAHDNNTNDTLSFAWTGTAGSFSAATAPATSWTAPATQGVQVLKLEVTDNRGASATMSFEVSVQNANATGNAEVTVGFNSWPSLSGMRASPSVLALNGTTVLSVTATDADGDTVAYAWSSNCRGTFNNPAVASPAFTLQTLPPEGRCSFTVQLSDGRGGTHQGKLGLKAGNAAQPNVAPRVLSTFKSAEQANGGQQVTVGLTAQDPEGTPLAFAWSAPLGSLQAPRSTSTSSEVDWVAPACFDAPVVLTATITDATGVSTAQKFSIPPGPSAACGPLAVTGVRNIRYVQSDGSLITVPADLSTTTLGAWVPSAAEPSGYAWRPGSAQSNGTFVIPNVESTPFLMQVGTSYVWSTSRSLDLSYAALGRPDVELEPEGTLLNLQLTGLAPWGDADDVQLTSMSSGLSYQPLFGCPAPDFAYPTAGDTALSGSINYGEWVGVCGNQPVRIDPARGDTLYVTQLSGYTDAEGVDYQEVRRALATNGLPKDATGTLQLSGMLAAPALSPQGFSFRAPEFAAQVLASNPGAGMLYNTVNVGALPGYAQHGTYTGWPDLALAWDYTPLNGDLNGTFQYTNPFPSTWTPFVTAQAIGRVRFTLPLPDGTPSPPRSMSVIAASREPLMAGSHPPLFAKVGVPQDVRINGQSAAGDLTGVGTTPVVSWQPPALGTVTRYNVRINRIYLTGTFINRVTQASINTTQTQLRIPPGQLLPGETYFLQVYAYHEPGFDITRPYQGSAVSHYATALTGKFQP
jgi:hypothetical protein